MRMTSIALGICKSARCNVDGNMPVERYEGPGMFCPSCGELLQAYDPLESTQGSWTLPAGASMASESLASQMPSLKTSQGAVEDIPSHPSAGVLAPARRKSGPHRFIVGASSLAALTLVAVVVVAGTLDHSRAGASSAVGICGSSMSERLARDVLRAYTVNQAYADHFEVRMANCDVRFGTVDETHNAMGSKAAGRLSNASSAPIAYDAVVAIVNPQNPVSQLSVDQLQDVYSGAVTRWSSIHGPNEPITIYATGDGTDEGHMLSTAILKGAAAGSNVIRLASSAEVVRAVTAANGRGAIGIVAFSQAVPGKVLAVKNYAVPSILSISEQKYPFILGIQAEASSMSDTSIPGLMKFASSDNARAIAIRDGYVQ